MLCDNECYTVLHDASSVHCRAMSVTECCVTMSVTPFCMTLVQCIVGQ